MRKLFFAILTINLTLGLFCLIPISAQYKDTITINADGSIVPSSAPIQRVGNTYTLKSNLTEPLIVQKNNTFLDGCGNSLFGQGTEFMWGELSLNHVSNVTLQNFYILFNNAQTIGILLNASSNVVVTNNTLLGFESLEAVFVGGGSYTGILVSGGYSNLIMGNNLTSNLNGITVIGSSNNQIVGNNIVGNSKYVPVGHVGVRFESASNNIVYHNNFVNSTALVDSVSINLWDNGFPSGGNYWSNYLEGYSNVSEIDNSGIGNKQYTIDPRSPQNKDRYPLLDLFNHNFFVLHTTPPKYRL